MVSIFAFFFKNDQKNGINIYTAVGNNSASFEKCVEVF